MSAFARLDLSLCQFTAAIHFYSPDPLEIYKKGYSFVPSCTAVRAYSNTCMAHDVVNTDVFYICCTPNMNVLWLPVYKASVLRDSLTTNITRFFNISAKLQYVTFSNQIYCLLFKDTHNSVKIAMICI